MLFELYVRVVSLRMCCFTWRKDFPARHPLNREFIRRCPTAVIRTQSVYVNAASIHIYYNGQYITSFISACRDIEMASATGTARV